MAQAVSGLAAGMPDNPAVQKLASALIAELGQYNEPRHTDERRQKPRRSKDQER